MAGTSSIAGTLVLQSFRTLDVPGWITRCVSSVEAWAAAHGHAYRFVGDELFELLPPRFRLRTSHLPQMMADLGRLLAARAALAEGYRQVVWVDADVIVFAPADLDLARAPAGDLVVCREVWTEETAGQVVIDERINNCVLIARGGTLLPFYIDACQQLVADAVGALNPLLIGTRFLTGLDRVLRLPRLESVALFSPDALREIASGEGGPHLAALRARHVGELAAANLCGSFRGRTMRPAGRRSWVVDDAVFDAAIDRLTAAALG